MNPSGAYFSSGLQREAGMLSRVADSLYWMSRYLERAEHTARLVDVEMQLWLDQAPAEGAGRWPFLMTALRMNAPDAPEESAGAQGAAEMIDHLVFNRNNSNSLVSCIGLARENLRHVREQCSSEMWEQMNRVYLDAMQSGRSESWLLQSHAFFRAVRDGAHLFKGITDTTMSHGEGWQYIQLGRYVERTDTVSSLIGAHFGRLPHLLDQAVEGSDYLEWIGLLRGCAAFEAYCKTYTAEIRPVQVAEFLLLNPDFPHSVRFSVDRLETALNAIGDLTERRAKAPARIAGRLRAQLSFSQIEEILADGAHHYLQGVCNECAQLHNAIRHIYFDYPVESDLAP
jgi:uncharacterized alpha-E superfamily protein